MLALMKALRLIVSLLPVILELVQAVERAAPFRGIGTAKLELLKGIVSDVYAALEPALREELPLEALLKAAVSIANRFVALFNKVGWPGIEAAPPPVKP